MSGAPAQIGHAQSLVGGGEPLPSLGEIIETLTFQRGFNTTTVMLGTTMLGIAAGIIGCYALLRKRSLMADALSHATLPGIALAFMVSSAIGIEGKSMGVLLIGAAVTGVLGVLTIQVIHKHPRVREDAAIGIVLSVFFGAGIVLLSIVQTMSTGSQGGLSRFIYGQTAAMLTNDAILMSVITVVAIVSAVLLLKEFALVSFNEGFARVTGWPVTLIDLIMMSLIVLVTVAGLQAVGLILVVALLIIPAAAARFWTDRLRWLVVIGAFIGGLSGYLGAAVSSLLPRKPAGAVIVMCAGAVFLASMLLAPRRGVLAQVFQRVWLRWKIARDHMLEQLYERDGAGESLFSTSQVRAMMRHRGWPAIQTDLFGRLLGIQGWISRKGGKVELSDRGRERGKRVARNHALWEQYLVSYADIAPSHVDWSVDKVEHVLSDELIAELEQALDSRKLAVRGVVS